MRIAPPFGPTVALAALLFMSACATTSTVPVPANAAIETPDSALPANVKGFSGKWTGTWIHSQTRMDHVLIVQSVTASSAKVIYAWGEPSNNYINIQPGSRTMNGTIKDGVLSLTHPSGATAKYTLKADGTLDGVYTSQGFNSTATLKRSTS